MAKQGEQPLEIPRILPRGRHGLGDSVVKQSQRLRMLEAMTAACVENGIAAVSVADVIERSGVSRKTFYEHFANKEECLMAAYDAGMEKLNERLGAAIAQAGDDSEELLRATISGYIDALVDDPVFARMLAIEMLAGGPAARRRRDEGVEMFIKFYWALIAKAGVEPADTARTEAMIVAAIGGVAELIRRTVKLKGPEALPSIKQEAIDITRALLLL